MNVEELAELLIDAYEMGFQAATDLLITTSRSVVNREEMKKRFIKELEEKYNESKN